MSIRTIAIATVGRHRHRRRRLLRRHRPRSERRPRKPRPRPPRRAPDAAPAEAHGRRAAQRTAARGGRGDHQGLPRRESRLHPRLPDRQSRDHPRRDRRAAAEAGRRGAGGAGRCDRRQPRAPLLLAAPGRARQSEGRRHAGRVLRLQLRLLPARPGRHAAADRRRPEPQASCSRNSRCSATARSRPRRSSIAVRILAPDKYGEFHDALIAQSGQVNGDVRARAWPRSSASTAPRSRRRWHSDEVKDDDHRGLRARPSCR